MTEQEEEIERLHQVLENIEAWARAYPIKVFPKPDYDKARKVLEAAGMTLDTISADCMRHVIESIVHDIRHALRKPAGPRG